MRTPNKYNIYKYLGGASLTFLVASLTFWKLYEGNAQFEREAVGAGMSASLVLFCLAILTRLTRPKPAKHTESQAGELLDKLAATRVGPELTDPQKEEVSISELIKKLNPRERKECENLLEQLYQETPACRLPTHYGGRRRPTLDWHRYDLCIIADTEDIRWAKSIRDELHKADPDLRIYVEREIGVPQVPAIKSVFFGSSRKCLALISVHAISNPRCKEELNNAMTRNQQVESEACRNYLMPIPLDKHGLTYMKGEPYLNQYATYLDTVREPNKLFKAIVDKLEDELVNPDPTASLLPPSSEVIKRPYAVALSYPVELPIVPSVITELEKRLAGEDLFYFSKYEAETGFNLDLRLQRVYGEQAELVVVFLCDAYARSTWCQEEWRVARELRRKHALTLLLLRFDEARIPGVLGIDGVIDCKLRPAAAIADIIAKRLEAIRNDVISRSPSRDPEASHERRPD